MELTEGSETSANHNLTPGYSVLYTQPLKMELTENSETSANHNLTPGKYPKEYIQYSKHGESLKSRRDLSPTLFNTVMGQYTHISGNSI
jgi:hypothetical protein